MTDDTSQPDRPDIVGVWEFTADEMDLLDLKEGDRLGMGLVGPPKPVPPLREGDLVVTTRSGAKLHLQPVGFDDDGNQIWRQVRTSFGGDL